MANTVTLPALGIERERFKKMFESLVESGSHKNELWRKVPFYLGTLALYVVVGVLIVVMSIVLVKENLPNNDLELMTMVAPVPVQNQPEQQPDKPAEAKLATATPNREVAQRTAFVAPITSTKIPDKVSTEAYKGPPPLPPGGARLGNVNTDPVGGSGPIGPVGLPTGAGGTGSGAPVVVSNEEEPPPPKATPQATPTPVPKPRGPIAVSGGVLAGKAIRKPQPAYPPYAKAARASGAVTVQVVVDEEGNVTSAKATGGHPMLQQAAAAAARQAKFTPTYLSGIAVPVSGVITYNFVLQ